MVFDSHNASAQEPNAFDLRQGLRPRGPQSDDLLTRERTAAALTAFGYRIKEKTLATKASRGGGPIYQVFNRRALYRWADALAWAQQNMRSPQREAGAFR
jgi:hypothetical protein